MKCPTCPLPYKTEELEGGDWVLLFCVPRPEAYAQPTLDPF